MDLIAPLVTLSELPARGVDATDQADAADTVRDEAPLIDALRRGEAWAFEDVHRRYTPLMLALATRYAGSRGLAEEIVQDTWLGVIKGIGRFEGRSTLKTWIFRILHYRARSASSKEARSITFSALAGASRSGLTHEPHDPHMLMARAAARCAHDCPEEQALRSEAGMLIASAIACLPKAQRAVVVLRDVAGWTAAEVCNHLELSAVYQRVLLYRARHHMRRSLNSYHL